MVHWSNVAQPTGVPEDVVAATATSTSKLYALSAEITRDVKSLSGTSLLNDAKLARFLKMISVHTVTMKYDISVSVIFHIIKLCLMTAHNHSTTNTDLIMLLNSILLLCLFHRWTIAAILRIVSWECTKGAG
jgi:hypothetical protein